MSQMVDLPNIARHEAAMLLEAPLERHEAQPALLVGDAAVWEDPPESHHGHHAEQKDADACARLQQRGLRRSVIRQAAINNGLALTYTGPGKGCILLPAHKHVAGKQPLPETHSGPGPGHSKLGAAKPSVRALSSAGSSCTTCRSATASTASRWQNLLVSPSQLLSPRAPKP